MREAYFVVLTLLTTVLKHTRWQNDDNEQCQKQAGRPDFANCLISPKNLRSSITAVSITARTFRFDQGKQADLRGAFGHYGENGGFLGEIGSNRCFPR